MVNILNARPKASPLSRPPAVRVNGATIARAEIAREMQNHDAADAAEAWTKAASALAVRALLLQEAKRLQLVPVPACDAEGRRETDEEALIRALVAREVKAQSPTEEECRRVHAMRAEAFQSPTLYEVRHILIAADPHDAAARQLARERADMVVVQLLSSAGCFEDLAATYSACPSQRVGGSLGQIGPGQTVPEFEAALARCPVGAVAPTPIETRYGFHVVLVERRIDGARLPFEAVRARIAQWLTQRAMQIAVRQYIGILAGRANVEGVELGGSSSPLVQ